MYRTRHARNRCSGCEPAGGIGGGKKNIDKRKPGGKKKKIGSKKPGQECALTMWMGQKDAKPAVFERNKTKAGWSRGADETQTKKNETKAQAGGSR